MRSRKRNRKASRRSKKTKRRLHTGLLHSPKNGRIKAIAAVGSSEHEQPLRKLRYWTQYIGWQNDEALRIQHYIEATNSDPADLAPSLVIRFFVVSDSIDLFFHEMGVPGKSIIKWTRTNDDADCVLLMARGPLSRDDLCEISEDVYWLDFYHNHFGNR